MREDELAALSMFFSSSPFLNGIREILRGITAYTAGEAKITTPTYDG